MHTHYLLPYIDFTCIDEHILYSRLAYACTPWPESEDYGCYGGYRTVYEKLSLTMNVSPTEECKILCLQQKEDGCCFLRNRTDCYWRKNAIANKIMPNLEYSEISTGLSITCNKPTGLLPKPYSN